jgi:hypothetical protein
VGKELPSPLPSPGHCFRFPVMMNHFFLHLLLEKQEKQQFP